MNNTKYLAMVCHTETFWATGDWPLLSEVFEELKKCWDAATQNEKRPLVTFCLTAEAVEDQSDFFGRLRDDGHEIGVHTHLPGSQRGRHSYSGEYAYRENEAGELNQDLASGPIRQMIIDAGLGIPVTHVSGMNTFRDTTACVLERAGLTIDCGLLPGAKRSLGEKGVLLCDNRGRTSPAAYSLSRTNHCQPGESGVLEFPVWGHLAPQEHQESVLRSAEESLQSGLPMAAPWESFWRERGEFNDLTPAGDHSPGKPEVVQMFFHYWDFIDAMKGDKEDFSRLREFLIAWGTLDGCRFATASQAAREWRTA